MSKYRYKIYFLHNEVLLLDTKKNHLVSDFFLSVQNDEIINEFTFHHEFTKFLHHHKIKLSLFGSNIMFITNYSYTNLYQNTLKNILLEYFKSVKFINIMELLNIKNGEAYLNITTNYIDYLYYAKGSLQHKRFYLSLFNNNIKKIYTHLLSIYRPKKIYCFGNNPDIPKICNQLNKEQAILVIYLENYSTFVINLNKF